MTGTVSSATVGGVTTVTVSLGGSSEAFTLTGGVYVNAQGGGSTLTLSGGTYTYTSAQGAVAIFQTSLAGYIPSYAVAQLALITFPDGRAQTYTYQTVTVSGQSASRVQSVNNNFVYQLKFTYQNNSPASLSDLTAWTTVTDALALMNRLEPVRCRWRAPADRVIGKELSLPLDKPQIGFIAQQVARVVPEDVSAPSSAQRPLHDE